MTTDFRCVVPYIGADALFIFLTVLVWFVWLISKARGAWGALALGLVAGLAMSTKINGSFMIAGAILYYALASRGAARVARPIIILAASCAVYLALDPIYFGGGWLWAKRVFTDAIGLMEQIKNDKTGASWAAYTHRETILAAFPCIMFAVPVAALAWRMRRNVYLAPTVFWSVPVILGNLALIYMPDPRYSAPIRVAFLVLLAVTGLTALKSVLEGARATCADTPSEDAAGGAP